MNRPRRGREQFDVLGVATSHNDRKNLSVPSAITDLLCRGTLVWTQILLMSEVTERLSSALADRYRIERHLGEGGMATVRLAGDLTPACEA